MGALFTWLDGLIRSLVSAGFVVSAVAMLAMMLIGSVDVIGTAFFSAPVPAALEAQEVLLAVSIFLALAYAQSRHEHIDVDIIVNFFPERVRSGLRVVPLAVGALICGVIAARSWALAMSSWEIREAANAIITFPIYPGKFLVSIGAWLATLEFVRQLAWWFLGGDPHAARRESLSVE